MDDEPPYTALFPADQALRRQGHPFAIPDLWRPSTLAPDLTNRSCLFPDSQFLFPSGEPSRPRSRKRPADPTAFPFTLSRSPSPIKSTLFKLPTEFEHSLPELLGRKPWPEEDLPPLPESDDGLMTDDNVFSSESGSHATEKPEVEQEVEQEVEEEKEQEEVDVWQDPETRKRPEEPRVYTWESFLVPDGNEPQNAYISEAGPAILDAALDKQAGSKGGTIIRADVFCTCLLHLGLGRSSVLFIYDRKRDEFKSVKENLRVSGCTAGTTEAITKAFSTCGIHIKRLERFAHDVYANNSYSPALVALAQCTTTIVEEIQKRLSLSYRTIRSVLHLHSMILEPALIVDAFLALSEAVKDSRDDSVLLSRLFDSVQQQQHRSGWLRPLLVETLARASRPWLETVERWIGLDHRLEGIEARGLFINVDKVIDLDENGKPRDNIVYTFDKDQVPSFLSPETAETMFETGRSLRYLEKFHPKHPLATARSSSDVPKLEWKFSWEDMEDLQNQAKTHETTLREAIKLYTSSERPSSSSPSSSSDGPCNPSAMSTTSPWELTGLTKEEVITHLTASAANMDSHLPPLQSATPDPLAHMVHTLTSTSISTSLASHLTTFAPPLATTPLISFTHILSVQSQLVNKCCLRLFLKEHALLSHLSLLRQFMLFGSGLFSSRLASALFSPDVGTTERTPNTIRSGGSMGLKLGSRESWPPASSELRLALMDVLNESYFPSTTTTSCNTGIHASGKTSALPGGLSFAVREMSDTELDACMDADGISALDFLRLEYRPPAPLDAVITPAALYRYDQLFRLLLRLLRMVFVVTTTLFHDTRRPDTHPTVLRFAIEVRHFVTTLAGYMLDTAIGTTWAHFETQLHAHNGSVERLRALHEAALDRIMFAALCRKRQLPVMNIVDAVFGTVLRFARHARLCAQGRRDEAEQLQWSVEAEYTTFRRQVKMFITVCRGLSEKRGYGQGRVDTEAAAAAAAGGTRSGSGHKEEANLLSMLLLGLEMSGYYTNLDGMEGGVGVGVSFGEGGPGHRKDDEERRQRRRERRKLKERHG